MRQTIPLRSNRPSFIKGVSQHGFPLNFNGQDQPRIDFEKRHKALLNEAGPIAVNFFKIAADLYSDKTGVFKANTHFDLAQLPDSLYDTIINVTRLNDVKRINKFLEAVNGHLPEKGVFIGSAETKKLRKIRIFNKFPAGFAQVYYFLDFVFKRIFPKLKLTRKLYFFLTEGRNRVLSRWEIIGRLHSCGFRVVEEQIINNQLHFVAVKIKQPVYDMDASYGLLFRMRRIGKGGKSINVYKIRTMYPYSEYLQQYVFERNHLQKGGKFNNDIRVTRAGKILRKFWIDELPMIYNLFNGDLKLVGVRPLSSHYLSLYTDDLKEQRLKHKPGLIPPFYVDMPKTLEEIMASEKKYLTAYEKHPILTDIKYFFFAGLNIIFRRARSK